MPPQGTSNEYPQYMVSLRNKKNISTFLFEKNCLLELLIVILKKMQSDQFKALKLYSHNELCLTYCIWLLHIPHISAKSSSFLVFWLQPVCFCLTLSKSICCYNFFSHEIFSRFLMCAFVVLFVCVEVLWPSQPNGVMSSMVSLPNHMFTGQA